MAKRSKLATIVGDAAHDPAVRAVAASTVVAGGVIATGKVVHDRVEKRARLRRRRYRIQPGETPIGGVSRITRGQLDLTIGLLRGKPGEDGGSAVHEARKALKRLRALLRVSRGFLGEDRYRYENVVLRDAGRRLSGTRDAQVLLDTLDDLSARYAEELPETAWSRLREALAADVSTASVSDGSRMGVVDTLSGTRTRVATWPLPQHGGPASFASGLERIYRRGRRAARAARSNPTTDSLHELRKRAKDLWHAAQLLRAVSPKRMRKLGRRAHRLSDLLGDDHDLSVLLDRAGQRPELLEPGEVELLGALVKRRQGALRREALARAAELYHRKPRKLMDRLAPA